MKHQLLLLVFFFSTYCFCQKIIHLTYVDTSYYTFAKLSGTTYRFLNPSDSSFLTMQTKVSGFDMGQANCYAHYILNPKILDGDYKIYVDSFLKEKFCCKDGQKISTSTSFNLDFRQCGKPWFKWDEESQSYVNANPKKDLVNIKIYTVKYWNSDKGQSRIRFHTSKTIRHVSTIESSEYYEASFKRQMKRKLVVESNRKIIGKLTTIE